MSLNYIFSLLLLLSLLTSCNPGTVDDQHFPGLIYTPTPEATASNDPTPTSTPSSTPTPTPEVTPTPTPTPIPNAVSITSPAVNAKINSTNKSSFTVSGTCSHDGQAVALKRGATVISTFICAAGAWSINADLSNIVTHPDADPFTLLAEHGAGTPAQSTRQFIKDTVVPEVQTVSSTNADGGFIAGEQLVIEVEFDDDVNVVTTGGTPYITLEMGATDRNAAYVSGSGSDTLVFNYTIQSGDTNVDLDYVATNSLNLNGGTILDANENPATLTLSGPGTSGSISFAHAITVCAGTSYSSTGAGTKISPYRICNASQLASIGANATSWSSYFQMLRDINLSAYTEASDGTQWIPIGNSTNYFQGIFDGNNKTISNFSYAGEGSNTDYVGIFGYVDGPAALIKNVILTNVAVTGRTDVGALAGFVERGIVLNSRAASGTVDGAERVGGLIGTLRNGAILSSSSASVTVGTTTTSNTGGLVGWINLGNVYNSYSSGNVSCSHAQCGGLAGNAENSVIFSSFSTGNVVSNNTRTAGLVGAAASTYIYNCFATGNVTGSVASAQVGYVTGSGGASILASNTYYNSDAVVINTGGTNTNGTTGNGSHTGGYFYDDNNPPLSSYDQTHVWNFTGTSFPTLAVTYLDEDAWGDCNDHLSDAPFAGGAGTVENPYLICTGAQWQAIGSSASYWGFTHFKLMDDIDLSAYTGTTYNLIGNSTDLFLGSTIDGNGFAINNFKYNSATNDNVGLVSYTSNSIFRRINIQNIDITADNKVGSLIAHSNNNFVMAIMTSGIVRGNTRVGGVIGSSIGSWAFYSDIFSAVDVTGTISRVGGIIGESINGTLKNSFATGDIQGNVASNVVGKISGQVSGTFIDTYTDSNASCVNLNGGGSCNATGTSVDTTANPNWYFYAVRGANNMPFHNGTVEIWDFTNVWQQNTGAYPSLRN